MKTIIPYFIFIALIMVSCSSGGSDEPTPEPIPDPAAAILTFPEKDKECTQGTVKSDTESDLTFEWNSASNADSYEVNLRNLNTNTSTTISSTTNSVTITILRGTPYEWYVVSKANGTTVTASSDKWKFYNEGPGIENYTPFPADVISPNRGAQVENTGTVSLEWSGSDVDNDIDDYEVFFGTANPPTNSLVKTTNTTTDASINANTIYYWYVVTTDLAGNTSTSETFEFKVKN